MSGPSELLEEVSFRILEQVRDKEKEVLVLHKRDKDGNVVFKAGLLKYVTFSLNSRGYEFDVELLDKLPLQNISDDLLYSGPDPIILRDYQVTSIRKGFSHRRGIFNIATGGGKTEIIIGLAKLVGNSLIIVPSKSSLKQTYRRLKSRGLSSVGRFGGGYKELNREHTIATASMFNSRLNSGDLEVRRFLSNIELLMFDEVHHLGTAPSWLAVANACPAPRRFGFSGSPWASGMPTINLESDKESKYADFRVAEQVGEELVYIPSKMLRDMGVIIEPRMFVVPVSEPKGLTRNPFPRWNWVYRRGIIENEARNKMIVDASSLLCERGYRPTILVVSIPHGVELLKMLYARHLKAAFSKGDDEVLVFNGKKTKTMKNAGEKVRDDFQAGELDVLIGSVIIDEAIDLPGMSALILAGGMKSPIRAVQRIGRAIRTADGKEDAVVIDFRDKQHFWLESHTTKRLGIYDAHEYHYEEVSWDELWKAV